MTKSVEELLKSYELLPDEEKRQVASEIIKRSLVFDLPQLSDEELVFNAEQIFLRLDTAEPLH